MAGESGLCWAGAPAETPRVVSSWPACVGGVATSSW